MWRSSSGSLLCSTNGAPSEEELAVLLSPGAHFSERPNLLNPSGSERDVAAMRAGIKRGQELLAWQAYEVRDHAASGDTVVTRMRSGRELAVAAGAWPTGTRLTAWCVAHYRVVDGRIVRIE
jgi:SnoaL-like domain